MLSLWTSILHCHSPDVATVARRLRYSYSWLRFISVVVLTVATPGEWQCKKLDMVYVSFKLYTSSSD